MDNFKTDEHIVICPHCHIPIIIEKINCGIFRHGTLKINNTQVPPHLNKEQCDYLKNNDLVYGCCKPFKLEINKQSNSLFAISCGYI